MSIKKSDPKKTRSVIDKLRGKTSDQALEKLKDEGVISYDERDLPEIKEAGTWDEDILLPLILAYTVYDFHIGTQSIARSLHVDHDVIRRIRNSEKFKRAYFKAMNDILLTARGEAIQTLREIIENKDDKYSPKNVLDACQIVTNHTSEMAKIYIEQEKQHKPVDVNVVLKELEDLE